MTQAQINNTGLTRAIFLVLIALTLAGRSLAQTPEDEFRKGEVIVEIRPGGSVDAVNARIGTSTIERIYGTNLYRLETPRKKKESKFRKRLSNDADVLSAALNPVVMSPISLFGRSTVGFPGGHPTLGQAQSQYSSQQVIKDLEAIHLRSRGAGVVVAVIDTGVDRTHPDIAGHLWSNPNEVLDGVDNDGDGFIDDVRGWDFINKDNDPTEGPGKTESSIAGHGTFIAGLVALVAPDAKIMPVRAFDTDGVSDAFTVAEAIKFAADHGAQVINLSFGSPEDSQVMHDAVAYAKQRSTLLIAAVGNENKNTDTDPQFPANWKPEVMGVAAIDSYDHKADFSNFGKNVSVSAPGVGLFSTYPQSDNRPDYAIWSGTSFAAPLASAEAALLLEDTTHQDTRATIEDTATNIDDLNQGFEGKLGKGRINPLAALRKLQTTDGNRGRIPLLPTGPEPTAGGKAEISVIGEKQELEIEADGHYPRSAYKIVVDGTVIIDGARQDDHNSDKARATNFGSFKVKFSTEPGSGDLPLPLALNPVNKIRRVEVRDLQDRLIVANEFGAPSPVTSGQSVEKEATLTPNNTSSTAKGRARAEVEAGREKLRIEAEDLRSGVAYDFVVDGISLGSFVAQSGFCGVEFRSDASSGFSLPPSLRPVTKIQRIEVRTLSGLVVLQGSFQAGGDDFGGGNDGGGGGGGGDGQEIRREADLNPTGVDADAEGKVKIRMSSGRESLEIEAEKLNPNAQYTIMVDSFSLGSFMTDGSGSLEVSRSTEAGNLPPQVRPVSNIQNVRIIDSLGSTVLTGGPPR